VVEMNKLTVPMILAATILIAGMFAIMPIEKASTTHRPNQVTSGALTPDSITAETIAAGAITTSEAPYLDAPVSSRASPSDILIDTNSKVDAQMLYNLDSRVTDTRAGNLDNLDVKSSAIKAKTDLIGNANPATSGTDTLFNFQKKIDNKVGATGAFPLDTLFNALGELLNRLTPSRAAKIDNLDTTISSRADGSAYTNARAAKLDSLDATVSSRATAADIDTQDRFMTINIPAGASNIGSTAITIEKTNGYTGFATIVAVVTTSQAGKDFKLEADTNSDGIADTDVAKVTLSSTGTRIGTGSIPNGTDRLFISSSGATSAAFSANVTIQFDSILP
jgi:hypothetical protein